VEHLADGERGEDGAADVRVHRELDRAPDLIRNASSSGARSVDEDDWR